MLRNAGCELRGLLLNIRTIFIESTVQDGLSHRALELEEDSQ